MSDMITCDCGSKTFIRRYSVRGLWKQLVESNDAGGVDVAETNLDSIRDRREPKFMRCADCKKRVPNPNFEERVET